MHSLVRFQFGTEVVEVPNIVGEQGLNGLDSVHLDRSVLFNYPLTTLMPFAGGVVEVTAALLAMEGQDYLKRFIGVLSDFAGLVAVPQPAALEVAKPLASGIGELLGGSDSAVHPGLHQPEIGEFVSGTRPGWSPASRARLPRPTPAPDSRADPRARLPRRLPPTHALTPIPSDTPTSRRPPHRLTCRLPRRVTCRLRDVIAGSLP
ncbi:MAG TPA: hypothetical protein VFQ44_20855 [Streptosporangiaceae bacterium]|nr:hypothetical protein [Streptosporangiaceae bacterium]